MINKLLYKFRAKLAHTNQHINKKKNHSKQQEPTPKQKETMSQLTGDTLENNTNTIVNNKNTSPNNKDTNKTGISNIQQQQQQATRKLTMVMVAEKAIQSKSGLIVFTFDLLTFAYISLNIINVPLIEEDSQRYLPTRHCLHVTSPTVWNELTQVNIMYPSVTYIQRRKKRNVKISQC